MQESAATHERHDPASEECCPPSSPPVRGKELFQVLPPAVALATLEAHLPDRGRTERVATIDALGRVLAETLRSPSDLPGFARSTMDGFAVRAADTYGASESLPAYLSVRGEVLMGRAPEVRVGVADTARIATGGMIPEGADAVVMVEHTQEVDALTIEVMRPVAPGENVIQVGEDVEKGAPVLSSGHTLRPQDLGGLLALGITSVEVAAPVRVGILASGDELVPADQEVAAGQVRDINSHTLAALVRQAGHEPVILGIVPDVYESLRDAGRRGLETTDVLIFSAGSSVSTRDMTADVIASLGEPGVLVHGVALKPGKPTILAVANGKPVFGLPGNPVSCIVTFDLFVRPVLSRLGGAASIARASVSARLARNVASIPGREDYVHVRLERRDGETWAEPVFGKSNLIYTLVRSEGVVRIDLDRSGLNRGDAVEVTLF